MLSPEMAFVGPTKGLAPRFNLLHDRILSKITEKAGQRQLQANDPSILVIDIETWWQSAKVQFHVLGDGAMAGFPVDDMPPQVAALIITTISPVSARPAKLSVTLNPRSPYADDARVGTLLSRMTIAESDEA
jgi:hypothetical protein